MISGYFQLLRDSSDELFAVVKISRFYLTEEEAGGFQAEPRYQYRYTIL